MEVTLSDSQELRDVAAVPSAEEFEGGDMSDDGKSSVHVVSFGVVSHITNVGLVSSVDVHISEVDGRSDMGGTPNVDFVRVQVEGSSVEGDSSLGGSEESHSVGSSSENGISSSGEPISELNGRAVEGSGGVTDLGSESRDVQVVMSGPLSDLSEDLGSVTSVLNDQGVGDSLDVLEESGVLNSNP